MNSPSFRAWLDRGWPLLTLLLIATVWLYRSPYNASNLEVPPDSVEYAFAPLELLENGHYEIVMEGRGLPPRYPPWFPVLVILPAYVLFGHNPGNGILPITFFAVGGVGLAWAIGRRISSTPGGLIAGLAVLAIPSYSLWGKQIMTDVPCTALMLAGCLLYLRLRAGPESTRLFVLAGVLVAVATLFRPVFAAMLLPFALAALRERRTLLRSGAALLLPIGLAAIATFIYNATTFGSPMRNGYHFWTAVPADYPALTFSISHVRLNLLVLWHTAFPLLVAVAIVLWLATWKRRKKPEAGSPKALADAFRFIALTTGPMLLFHLLYFFPSDRFYLPMMAGTAVLAGSTVGFLIDEQRARLFKLLMPLLLLLVVAGQLTAPPDLPLRRMAAERVRKFTPPNAIIISGIEPVYLERLAARGTERRIVPLSRQVEYASKLIVWKRIAHPQPPPVSWRDHRAEGMIRGGAEEAIRSVADEQITQLAEEAAEGRPLFLETSAAGGAQYASSLAQLHKRFAAVLRAPYLYELHPL